MNIRIGTDEQRDSFLDKIAQSQSATTAFVVVITALFLLSTVLGVSVPTIIGSAWTSYIHVLNRVQAVLLGRNHKSMEGDDASPNFGEALHNTSRSGGGLMARMLGFGREGLLKGDIPLRGIGSLLKGVPQNVPPGLGNYDNSCYQNSVIQVLADDRDLKLGTYADQSI